jgi:hypothetical protein
MIFQNRGMADRHLPVFALRAGALALVLALAACGGGGSNSNLPAAALAGAAASGATPTATTDPALDAATVACLDHDGNKALVKPKTITIFNNSDAPIYPVVTTSANGTNEWIQGCFRDTSKQYPTALAKKLYVNEGKGIAKNASVTITLPLFSKVSETDYTTWWNGGRVLLADRVERLRDDNDKKMEVPNGVSCQGQNGCELSVYSSTGQIADETYSQLSEFTFGDSIADTPVGAPVNAVKTSRLLKTDNVGYNISYVDSVYMPVAIEPKNNPYIGYSGSTASLVDFRKTLQSFLDNAGQGWPVYNLNQLKLPAAYKAFADREGYWPASYDVPVKVAGDNSPVLTVTKCIAGQCSETEKKSIHYGQAIQRMQDLWGSCVDWTGYDLSGKVTPNASVQCSPQMKADLEAVKTIFTSNYNSYRQLIDAKKCDPNLKTVTISYIELMKHIYGWVPFNESCGAKDNDLASTIKAAGPAYAKVQSTYTSVLQYNSIDDPDVAANPALAFNPYVKLIHGDLQMNAYGFSIDDAVGFMSELGDGLVFTLGGNAGLANGKAFDYRDGFSVAIGVPKYMETQSTVPLIKKYGVCSFNKDASDANCEKDKQDVTMPAHSLIAGFRVGTVPGYPIRVRFTDLNDNEYAFVIKDKFAATGTCPEGTSCPPDNTAALKADFDCSVLTKAGMQHAKSKNWCDTFNPNQSRKDNQPQTIQNTASFYIPVDQLDGGPVVSP